MAYNTSGKTKKEDAANKPPVGTERITVALIPMAADDLQALQDRTGLSKTDIVNRAITAYEFFESSMRAGNDLLVRDPETGEIQIVKFL